jgi:hypothetical protein
MAFIVWEMLFKKEEPPETRCEHQRNPEAGLYLGDMNDAGKGKGHHEETGTCAICALEQKAMKNYRRRLIVGLALPFTIQSLDTTVVAGAITTIASDFSQSFSHSRR